MLTCDDACGIVGDCAAGDDLCPGIDAASRDAFVDGCLEACAGQPALISLVQPDDCAATVGTLSNINPQFRAACEGPEVDPRLSMCGGFGPRPGLPDENAITCAACVDASCCEQATACGDDADCLALRQCFITCAGDGECEAACPETHAAGLDLNQPFIDCRNTSCSEACRIPEDWSCLGSVMDPDVVPGNVDISILFRDFVSGALIAGATVKACARADEACEAPLAEGATDAAGIVTLNLAFEAGGFSGYFEITGGNATPSLFFPNPPFFTGSAPDAPRGVSILTPGAMGVFAQLSGVEPDPTRGHAGLRVLECRGRLAANVSVAVAEADADSTLAYIQGGVPNASAMATDVSGTVGVFNVPAGPITFTGMNEDGQGVGEFTAFTRAGFVSFTNLAPRP